MKTGTSTHPKTMRLCQLLKIPRWQAAGILSCLWEFACDYSPRGDIGKWDDQQIAAGIEWTGNCSELISALTESGWVDLHDEHRLILHDWKDHAPKFIKERLKYQGLAIVQPDSAKIRQNPANFAHKARPSQAKQGEAKPSQANTSMATPAAPCVCDSEPEKRNTEPQDDSLYDFEARLSPEAQEARAGLESAWRAAREQAGLAPAIDGNARRGLDVLSLAVVRGEFSLPQAAEAMRRFLRDQKAESRLAGYGLKGFAENISRWLPSQAPTRAPAPARSGSPAPPPPDAAKLEELLARAEAQGDQNRASQIRKLLESMEAKACG